MDKRLNKHLSIFNAEKTSASLQAPILTEVSSWPLRVSGAPVLQNGTIKNFMTITFCYDVAGVLRST